MSRRRTAVALTVLAGVLTLAGCGSSGSSDSSAPATSPATSPSATASTSSSTSPSTSPSTTSSAPSGSSPSAASALIVIKDYAYSGASSFAPGATVTVRNDDGVAHTVTADTGSAFGVTVPAGKTVTFTAPSKAGTYAYHCEFHATMSGSLTVR